MHAFLRIGGTSDERMISIQSELDAKNVASYNRIVLTPSEKSSVGIADVRMFIHKLQLAPQTESIIAGIIPEAETLTPQAQQALLKTIEEPPLHVRLYLGASSETSVLATIVSRCEIVFLASRKPIANADDLSACSDVLVSLCRMKPGDRITAIQAIGKTKNECMVFINQALLCLRTQLVTGNTTYKTKKGVPVPATTLAHALLRAKELTERNVNPHHILENIFLPL